MAQKRQPAVNDIIKITHFDGMTIANPLWAQITYEGSAQYISYGIYVFVYPDDEREALIEAIGDDTFETELNEEDVWSVVPDARVPDYVWATLAKKRLLGE